jgi:hypothetical protein
MTSRRRSGCIRPVTVDEMALAFHVSPRVLRALLKAREIRPTFVIDGLELFAGGDVRRVLATVQDSGLVVESA